MNFYEAFQILGISYTSDKKTIKKAYADLVKKYHPEDNPEQWEEIHKAYENALMYAKIISNTSKKNREENLPNREIEVKQQEQREEENSEKLEAPKVQKEHNSKKSELRIENESFKNSDFEKDDWQELYGGLLKENEKVSIDNKETYHTYFKDLPEYTDNFWIKEKREAFRRKLIDIYKLTVVHASDLEQFFQSNEYREMRQDYRCLDMIYNLCKDKKWGMRTNKVAIRYIKELEEELQNDVEIVNLCKNIQLALSHNGLNDYTMSISSRGKDSERRINKRVSRTGIIVASISLILFMISHIYVDINKANTSGKTNYNSEIPDFDSMLEYNQEYMDKYYSEREKTPSEYIDDSLEIADGIYVYNNIGFSSYLREEDFQCVWKDNLAKELEEQFEGKDYRTFTCKILNNGIYNSQIWMIDTVYLKDLDGEQYTCYLYQDEEWTMIPIRSEPTSVEEMLDGTYGVIDDGKICLPIDCHGTDEITIVFLTED